MSPRLTGPLGPNDKDFKACVSTTRLNSKQLHWVPNGQQLALHQEIKLYLIDLGQALLLLSGTAWSFETTTVGINFGCEYNLRTALRRDDTLL